MEPIIDPTGVLSIVYEHVSDLMAVVKLVGEIDVYSAPTLREVLVDLINHGRHLLIIEMNDVNFLDSTGNGVLVGALKRVRAHDGQLAIVSTQERVLKIFRITGLTKVFLIYPTLSEAEESLPQLAPAMVTRVPEYSANGSAPTPTPRTNLTPARAEAPSNGARKHAHIAPTASTSAGHLEDSASKFALSDWITRAATLVRAPSECDRCDRGAAIPGSTVT